MIDMSKYGFKHRSAFLKATQVPPQVIENVSNDADWHIAKLALLHPECPLALRDKFASDPIWYKRTVAYFATKAPKDYYLRAGAETDKRIRRFFLRTLEARTGLSYTPPNRGI